MPSKRSSSRSARAQRRPVRRTVRTAPDVSELQGVGGGEQAQAVLDAPVAAAPATAPIAPRSRSAPARPGTTRVRPRSRVPSQIVVANYDFLRHDLRLLAVLAPSLIVVMLVASQVIR